MRPVTIAFTAATALAAGLLAGPVSAHAAAGTWYVGPQGSGDTGCSKPAPCSLVLAAAAAPAGTTVVLLPGTYGSSAEPLTTTVGDQAAITLEGEPGAAVPTIYEDGTYGIDLDHGSRATRIREVYSGDLTAILDFHGSIDHISVTASTASTFACQVLDASISDSLCVNNAPDGTAVADRYFDFATAEQVTGAVRGVTAIATGAGGVAFLAYAFGPTTMKFSVTNSIGVAPVGIEAAATSAASSVTVALSHSDYGTVSTPAGPGTETVSQNSTDVHKTAMLIGSGPTPYAEKATSPTVDRGAADAAADTDLAGRPRTLGAAPDMGAYELRPMPIISRLRVVKRRTHSVTVSVRVSSGRLPCVLRVVAKSGHRIRGAARQRTTLARARTVRLTVRGLTRHQTYQLTATIGDAAGKATAPTKKVSTRS
jgi:hypothetical protein